MRLRSVGALLALIAVASLIYEMARRETWQPSSDHLTASDVQDPTMT